MTSQNALPPTMTRANFGQLLKHKLGGLWINNDAVQPLEFRNKPLFEDDGRILFVNEANITSLHAIDVDNDANHTIMGGIYYLDKHISGIVYDNDETATVIYMIGTVLHDLRANIYEGLNSILRQLTYIWIGFGRYGHIIPLYIAPKEHFAMIYEGFSYKKYINMFTPPVNTMLLSAIRERDAIAQKIAACKQQESIVCESIKSYMLSQLDYIERLRAQIIQYKKDIDNADFMIKVCEKL
jgi:hypothetical protein